MMKKSKLFLFSIFATVASLFISSNVFAFSKGEYIGHDYYQTPLKSITNAVKGTGYSTYSMYAHYTMNGDKKYYLYCIDPARKSGGSNASLHISRVLDQNEPKDAVVLAIISDPNYSIYEKVIAVRAWVPFNGDLSRAHTITSYEYNEGVANANSGVKWAATDPASMKAIFGLENPTEKNIAKIAYLYKDYNSSVVLNDSNATIKKAKEVFLKGLKYGASIASGKGIYKKNISYSTPSFTKDKYEIVEEDGVRKAIREITFSETFTKFNDGTTDPVTISINADTKGAAVATKYEYQVYGTDTWTEFDASTDFKPLLDKDSVTINFRVSVKAAVTSKSSFNINFKVETNFKDEKILTGALLYNTKNTNKATQRFYIYDEEPSKNSPLETTLKWNDIVGYCTNVVPDKNNTNEFKDYINSCCRGNNEAGFNITDECTRAKEANDTNAINKYCTLKAEYCDYCNSKVTVPKTCSEFSEGEFEKGLTATITGPEDIKVCVMNGEDEANSPYDLTKDVTVDNNVNYSFENNKYCNVSCKEDYAFDLPTGRYVISGRYFTLKMGVEATKTCYTDLIDYDLFKKDLEDYANKLNSYISSGNASALNTEFVKVYSNYKKAITDIKACSLGWDNKYEVDPKISFDYDEEYIEKLLGGKDLEFKQADDKKTSESKWFCNGSDVDRKYETCIGGSATDTASTTAIDVIECNTSNATSYTCNTVSKQIPTTKYAKVTTKVAASYTPESIFYTKYSTGVIDINKNGNDKYTKLDSYLDSKIDESVKIRTGALPVSLKDGKGAYNYNIKFNNVGEYFDKNGFGRLVGGKQSVALKNNDTTFEGTYVCSYIVNCPECNVSCKEDPARGIFCKIDTADEDVTCVGTCAFDSNLGELYSVHQTSLTNFNPTGRNLGANLTTPKGEALISSITQKGEKIYDDPEYSFVFTPAVISFLRNDINANSSNGYLGEASSYDMKCSLYSDLVNDKSIKGTNKDYTICQSSVLDALDKDYKAVKVHTLLDSRSKISSWLDSDYCKENNCALVGAVGPAWK